MDHNGPISVSTGPCLWYKYCPFNSLRYFSVFFPPAGTVSHPFPITAGASTSVKEVKGGGGVAPFEKVLLVKLQFYSCIRFNRLN